MIQNFAILAFLVWSLVAAPSLHSQTASSALLGPGSLRRFPPTRPRLLPRLLLTRLRPLT
jgi:hypothetical protein